MNLFVANDNLIQLLGLLDQSTKNYINNATVTAKIKTLSNATTATISLGYVAGSNGNYQGTLPASTTLTADAGYNMVVNAQTPGGSVAEWNIPTIAILRVNPSN